MDDNTIMLSFAIVFTLFVVFLLIVQPRMYEVIPHRKPLAPTHVVGQTYWTISNEHWKGDYRPDGPNISRRWDPFPPPIEPPNYLPIKGIGTYYMSHNP
jgi:hypothetical protein